MEHVRRWDAGSVGSVERTDQGYLRCDATITKTGVFTYRQPGGKVRRELRLPNEVFHEDALRSFGLSPLTNGHPPVMLSARNTARYQVGSVADPRQDGDHVAASVQITDADAIELAESGRRQLSCGYNCDLEDRPGTTQGIPGVPDGLRYDAIQRNIRGNHVALVDKARAGSSVQLRLDGADAFQVDPEDPARPVETNHQDKANPAAGAKPMEPKITIDGVSFEVTEQVQQAFGKFSERADGAMTELAEVKAKLETERARADAAEENLAAEKKAREDAADPAKLRAAVDARLNLERAASPILGDEAKLDAMSDSEIKAAVVVAGARDKDLAKERLDGCGEEYLQARFDAALEAYEQDSKPNEGLAATRKAAKQVGRTDSVEAARQRMIEHNQKLGREALN